MKSQPITPARIAFDAPGPPRSLDYGDIYHPAAGAWAQAEHVFLRGNGLPRRWAGRRRFTILETGFGLGNNFLATWAAWRADPRRCDRLHYLAIDRHPPALPDLKRAHRDCPAPDLAAALQAQWPPLTFNLHRLVFDGGQVELLLALGEAAAWLRQVEAAVDAFYLDGFAPRMNGAMWSDDIFAALPALAAAEATAATWSVAANVQRGLRAAGFEVGTAPGLAGKREMTVARHAPRFQGPKTAHRRGFVLPARSAAVVGAGIAGALVAQALAGEGLAVQVFERAGRPAGGASGNPAGLYRGIVNRDDGPHARLQRSASLLAAAVYAPLIDGGRVHGSTAGLLQQTGDFSASRDLVERLGLPPDFVQAVDVPQARALTGLAGLDDGAAGLLFMRGGWVAPPAVVTLALASPGVQLCTGIGVGGLRAADAGWQLLDGAGRLAGQADIVVLANAVEAAQLAPWAGWPLQSSRGQVTLLPAPACEGFAPSVALAGAGYVVALPDGRVLCGATTAPDDWTAALRPEDHAHNLATLARLTGWPQAPVSTLDGRVGWRCQTADRQPIVGAMPAPDAPALEATASRGAMRRTPRAPGLFVITALGSRGLTLAPLAARIVAAAAVGAPGPLEAGLLDAIDPARYPGRNTTTGQR